jgi:hypothetical protein
VTNEAPPWSAAAIASAPAPYDVPISAMRPPGFDAASVATSRCTSGIE